MFRFPQRLWPIYSSWRLSSRVDVYQTMAHMISCIVFTWHIPPLIDYLIILFSWIWILLGKKSILNCFVAYLIYPSTTLLSDENVSCRQPISNSFLKNFAIFMDDIVATNSNHDIEIYFFRLTLAFPKMKLECVAPSQLTILIMLIWPYPSSSNDFG